MWTFLFSFMSILVFMSLITVLQVSLGQTMFQNLQEGRKLPAWSSNRSSSIRRKQGGEERESVNEILKGYNCFFFFLISAFPPLLLTLFYCLFLCFLYNNKNVIMIHLHLFLFILLVFIAIRTTTLYLPLIAQRVTFLPHKRYLCLRNQPNIME